MGRARKRSRTALLRDIKRVGKTRADVWSMVENNVLDTAKAQGWSRAEVALTLAAWKRDIDKVFKPTDEKRGL